MEKKSGERRKEPEIVYSRSVKAGKRVYYLDVKKTRSEDLYVCITESKKVQGEADSFSFEKHKIFLYKEDFKHFAEGLEDVIGYVTNELGEVPEREEWTPQAEAEVAEEEPAEESEVKEVSAEGKPRRFGFFRRG